MKSHEQSKSTVPLIPHRNQLLDLPVPINSGQATVDQLANRYYNSKYGAAMRDQPLRFEQNFGGYPREQRLDDYGPDACPVDHQKYSLDFLNTIIEAEKHGETLFVPSLEEQSTLAFAMSKHDCGESMHPDIEYFCGAVLGDLPAGTKTEEDRVLETNIRQVMDYIHYADVDPTVMERAEAIISHRDETLLHTLYEAAHDLQTLDTAQRAASALELAEITDHPDSPRLIALRGMKSIVLKTATTKLEQYRYLMAVDSTLTAHEQTDKSGGYTHFVTADNAQYHRACCLGA